MGTVLASVPVRVFSNSAMSADGKIATVAHEHVAIGSAEDRRFMSVLRARADAVLVGGQTFRNWPLPLVEDPGSLGDAPLPRPRPIVNAVLTRSGVVGAARGPARRADRWPDPRVRLLVFGPPGLDVQAHEQALGAEVRTRAEPDVAWVLDELGAMGCRSILVEGGGDLIFAILRAGRLHELYLTISPKLIGGALAPTPLDGEGLAAGEIVNLRLLDLRRVDDELFLHYEVAGDEASG